MPLTREFGFLSIPFFGIWFFFFLFFLDGFFLVGFFEISALNPSFCLKRFLFAFFTSKSLQGIFNHALFSLLFGTLFFLIKAFLLLGFGFIFKLVYLGLVFTGKIAPQLLAQFSCLGGSPILIGLANIVTFLLY